MNITFKLLTAENCVLLYQWLQLPHVMAFWDDGDRTLIQVREHYFKKDNVKKYLFFIDNEPAGYIQSYIVDEKSTYTQFSLPNKINVGIDFFIGNEAFLNKGLAFLVLENFIASCCQDADRIIVDPVMNNDRAIHIYKKFGFIEVGSCIIENKVYRIMAFDLL